MNIKEFVSAYRNHPILFVGTGVSLRYLIESFKWDELLKKIAFELSGNDEYYLDLKSDSQLNGTYRYELIASKLEKNFTEALLKDRDGKFKEVNDLFYKNMNAGKNIPRFKLYVAILLASIQTKPEMSTELAELKKLGRILVQLLLLTMIHSLKLF